MVSARGADACSRQGSAPGEMRREIRGARNARYDPRMDILRNLRACVKAPQPAMTKGSARERA